MNKQFNKAHYKDESLGIYAMKRIKIVEKLINGRGIHPRNALDIGGNPRMTAALQKALNCKFTVTNIDESFFEELKKKNNSLAYKVIDCEKKMPVRENTYDLIFCGELLEHIFNTDLFISECRRILRPHGHLIITTPNLASLFNRIFILFGIQPHLYNPSEKILLNRYTNYDYFCGHIKLFTHKSLVKFLEFSGFKIVSSKGCFVGHDGEGISRHIRKLASATPSFAENVIVLAENIK